MSITVSIIPNLLSADPHDYIAAVVDDTKPKLISDFENPLEVMGFKIENNEILPAHNSEIIMPLIREGQSLFTPFFNIRVCVTGKFNSLTDTFDEKRHERKIIITAGRQFIKGIKENPIDKYR